MCRPPSALHYRRLKGPLCAGQDGGCEAAVHAMKQIFLDQGTEATLLVNAMDAFNTINRQSALHNISVMCPLLTQRLINTYKHSVCLFITGGNRLPLFYQKVCHLYYLWPKMPCRIGK